MGTAPALMMRPVMVTVPPLPTSVGVGSRVTVIEASPRFLGLEEPEAGAALRPHLEADGITISLGDPCIAVEAQSGSRAAVVLHLKSGAEIRADRLLVATGRRANAEAFEEAVDAVTAVTRELLTRLEVRGQSRSA